MNMENQILDILNEELVLALGCTEPTALALASAKCRNVLGDFPEKITAKLSGNMIKNVQGVTIPHSNGLKGIRNAIIMGALIETKDDDLKVLEKATLEMIEEVNTLRRAKLCTYERAETDAKLYIEITMHKGDEYAVVELQHTHTNITRVNRSGEEILFNPCTVDDFNSSLTNRENLSVEEIFNFCNNVDYSKLKEILEKQFTYNGKIGLEGITNKWGLNVGKTLYDTMCGDSVETKMRSFAAAGSDARMSGCDLPVVINSGSGNQGMTIAIPIMIYGEHFDLPDEEIYRALALANLIPIHIKTTIGRLSAFCGAITASIGVGAGLAYLETKDLQIVINTIKNAIANLTGVICDGAKPSCALKIASGLDAAFMAKKLAVAGKVVQDGTGIITNCVEESICNMTDIASKAMLETDEKIIEIMQNTFKE